MIPPALVFFHTADGRCLVLLQADLDHVCQAVVEHRAIPWWQIDSRGAVQPMLMRAERYGVGLARPA